MCPGRSISVADSGNFVGKNITTVDEPAAIQVFDPVARALTSLVFVG